jgi:prefoldin subunit 5
MVGEIELNGETYLDANLSALPVHLVKAMQEQQTQIEALKSENETLKAALEELQTMREEFDKLKLGLMLKAQLED